MTVLRRIILLQFTTTLVLAQIAGSQALPSTDLIAIEGLRPEYTSCGYINLAIKNISESDVYVEIYAEKFESGSWNYENYPYDIKDPKSRYVKRVLVHPETLKPGASLPLTYDRCQRPAFVKETDKQYRKTIIERDAKSTPSSLHRFRIQVYFLDQGHVKFVKNVLSEPFMRIAAGNSTAFSAGSQLSQTLVGKRITIRGKFITFKCGQGIQLDDEEVVCLIQVHPKSISDSEDPYRQMYDKLVEATGTLKFYHNPTPVDETRQREADHYYFDYETAQIRLVSN